METSTKLRTFTKAIAYEISMFLLATFLIWIWFGSLSGSIIINMIITFIKMGCYYLNDRVWKTIRWGKINLNKKQNDKE